MAMVEKKVDDGKVCREISLWLLKLGDEIQSQLVMTRRKTFDMWTIPPFTADTYVVEEQGTTTPAEELRLPSNRWIDRLIGQWRRPTIRRDISQENAFMWLKIGHAFAREEIMKLHFDLTKATYEGATGKANRRPKLFV